jgi:hypothetical protein
MVCAATPDPGIDGDASSVVAGSMPIASHRRKPLKRKEFRYGYRRHEREPR